MITRARLRWLLVAGIAAAAVSAGGATGAGAVSDDPNAGAEGRPLAGEILAMLAGGACPVSCGDGLPVPGPVAALDPELHAPPPDATMAAATIQRRHIQRVIAASSCAVDP